MTNNRVAPPKSFEDRVIDLLVESDEYVEEFLAAVRAKASGMDLDMNKVIDDLHDSATMALSQRENQLDPENVEGLDGDRFEREVS